MAKLRLLTSTAAAAALMLGLPAAAQEVVSAPAPVVASAPTSGAPERTLGSESGGRTSVLYLGPLSLPFGGIPLEFEHALSPGSSFAILAGINAPIGLGAVFQAAGVSMFGGSVGAAYRGYFTGSAPTGLFIGPELEVSFLNAGLSGATESVNLVNVNGRALVGYSLVTPGGFAVSTGIGVGYGTNTLAVPGVSGVVQGHGFSFHLRANIGYGF
jgi:hypothetical protein